MSPSQYEKQNAIISYCFLGVFILLSRQERFRSAFVKGHARVATIIQFLFVLLIISSIYSNNFGSMLIFDISLANILYFILSITLFSGLAIGVLRALQGKPPLIHLSSLTLWEIKRHITPTEVDGIETIPMILSHIPLIGNFVAAKYWEKFYSGERFATWSFIVIIVLLWIDPSMTLAILFAAVVSIWIIYQSISLSIDGTMIVLWDRLPTARDVHISLLTFTTYLSELMSHTKGTLPSWQWISERISNSYHRDKTLTGEIVAIPLVNIPYIVKNIHTASIRHEVIQWIMISVTFIGALFLSYSTLFFVLYIGYVGFLSLRYQEHLTLPILSEIAALIQKWLQWSQNKSKKKTVTFTS